MMQVCFIVLKWKQSLEIGRLMLQFQLFGAEKLIRRKCISSWFEYILYFIKMIFGNE